MVSLRQESNAVEYCLEGVAQIVDELLVVARSLRTARQALLSHVHPDMGNASELITHQPTACVVVTIPYVLWALGTE